MSGFVRAAVCGLVMMMPAIAPAGTLTATFNGDFDLPGILGFQGGDAGQTAFVINFDDSLGSTAGVLEGAEFLSFAWVNNPFTSTIPGASFGDEFNTLLGVAPPIPGVVAGFVVPSLTNPFGPNPNNWIFRESPGSSTGSGIAASAFSYSTALPPPPPPPPPTSVPEPGTLALLALGLIGLGLARRRMGESRPALALRNA